MTAYRAIILTGTLLVLTAQAASAQDRDHRPPAISVSATANVDYVPDIARMQIGIRAQASTASAATNSVNQTAAQVIAAIERQGINQRSIQTSGYNLEYREPQPPQPQAGVMAGPAAAAGSYVASELLQVTTPVNSAGAVLDAAISAGANTSYGLTYQSSNAEALYREALAKAVQTARSTAQAIASAAHLTIVSVISIGNVAEQNGPGPVAMRMMAMPAAAQVLPGTDTVSATIYAVYAVK